MFKFQKLEIYKIAKALVVETYLITKQLPASESYCLVSQMNRAAISIPSNIAESCGRKTVNDKVYFLNIARSSLFELVCQMEISYELKYITFAQYDCFEKLSNDLSIRITNFITYIKKTF